MSFKYELKTSMTVLNLLRPSLKYTVYYLFKPNKSFLNFSNSCNLYLYVLEDPDFRTLLEGNLAKKAFSLGKKIREDFNGASRL